MSPPTVPANPAKKPAARQDSVAGTAQLDSPKEQDARPLGTTPYGHSHGLKAASRDRSDTFKFLHHEFGASSGNSRMGALRRSRSLGLLSDNISASSSEWLPQQLPHHRSIEENHAQVITAMENKELKLSQAAWASNHKILGQSKKPGEQHDASKSMRTNMGTDWPALNPTNQTIGHTRHLTDPFVDSFNASPVPSLDTPHHTPVITVTPPVPSSAPPFWNPPSTDKTTSITPSYASRAAWVSTKAKQIVTLCRQTTASLQAYRTTQSPSDFAAWKAATEAFKSAIDLERLQQDRRNMCLAPLGMNAMHTRVVEDTFGRWYDPDKIASGEESLLGYQMAIMERVCAVVRRREASPREEGMRSDTRSLEDLSPRKAERKRMIMRIEEATRRRISYQLSTDAHESESSYESEDKSIGSIRDLSPVEKKELRRMVVGYIKGLTEQRENEEGAEV